MKLSEHFTLEELTFSETAVRKSIDNTPDEATIENLKQLCENVLEPLYFNFPDIHINSCYRSPKLNTAIGGAKNSQHTKGQAVDITLPGHSVQYLFTWIKDHMEYDQLIQEFNSWVHVSWSGVNRNQMLVATKEEGKTVYTPVT